MARGLRPGEWENESKSMVEIGGPSLLTQIGSYMRSTVSFYLGLSAKIVCVWLSFWAIRKKGELDYPLDRYARFVRWAAVIVFFAIGHLPGPELSYVRISGVALGLAFLCWPNLAYHLTNRFRRINPEIDSSTD